MNKKQAGETIIKFRFYEVGEGGRQSPLPLKEFRCPMMIDNELFDCLINIPNGGPVNPGDTILASVEFLSPDLVLPMLHIGKKVQLWERGVIAEGEVSAIGNEK
ncbi:MAG: hypothetical protein KDB79_13005 [Acidobacteria bacterium]|nr:hypothetical protein [Acidobacteriota bacterium]